MIRKSDRLRRLPAYAVGELAAIKRRLLADGVDVIDLSAGDADLPPPRQATEALRDALGNRALSRYGFQIGLVAFREAAARYMERRFGVTLDPMTEILPLIGSKEGLAHLPLAVLDPGDGCMVPDPGYPPYIGGAVLSNADVQFARMEPEHEFLIELESLGAERLDRIGLAYLNYPNNPTTAVAPRAYLERTVERCRRHGIVLAYDNPYCELTFDGYRAPSVLEIEGARDVALEFHSMSKSFAMTGWRLGWAAGNPDLIARLSTVKSFVDTGPFLAVQAAGRAVLDEAEAIIEPLRATFTERRDVAVAVLRGAGLEVATPRATMYLWIAVPEGTTSAAFARELLQREGVMLVPGTSFGSAGEGFVRLALSVDPERLQEMGLRVQRCMERWRGARAGA